MMATTSLCTSTPAGVTWRRNRPATIPRQCPVRANHRGLNSGARPRHRESDAASPSGLKARVGGQDKKSRFGADKYACRRNRRWGVPAVSELAYRNVEVKRQR